MDIGRLYSTSKSWASKSWDSTYSFLRDQARFRQKQLQEKEEKLLKLYEEQQMRALKSVGSSIGGSSVSPTSHVGAGKVRCLFESRRRISEGKHGVAITGRDKSYPLEPLTSAYNSDGYFRSSRRIPASWSPRRSLSLDRRDFFPDSKFERTGWIEGASDRVSHRVAADRISNRISRSKPSDALDLSVSHGNKMEGKLASRGSKGILAEKPRAGSRNLARRSEISNGNVNSTVEKTRKSTPVPPTSLGLRKDTKKPSVPEPIEENAVRNSPARRNQPSSGFYSKPPTSAEKISARSSPGQFHPPTSAGKSSPPSDLVDCKICGRHFTSERVSKHEEVCRKSSRCRRKPFDALQQRVKGTEVEKYVKKSSKTAENRTEKPTKAQTDWRKKHEEFIQNIRAAKEVSIHLKKGGKLSDLPPPPPSDYSDYIQCPHCSRKFNSAAAERHIPKCANIINKPKPAMQRNAATKQGSKLGTSTSARGRK